LERIGDGASAETWKIGQSRNSSAEGIIVVGP
jgi:hypothetical protein